MRKDKMINKEKYLDKFVEGTVGFTVTYIVNLNEPTLISNLYDNWDSYIDDNEEYDLEGLQALDCVIK
jgi:hypothetical protein